MGIVLLVSCAGLISSGCRAKHTSDAGTKQTEQGNSIVHATGTIVSVDEQAHDEQSYDLLPGPRVCFNIDSFAELPAPVRDPYESTERQRQAALGPRCRETRIDPSVVHIKPGDRVDVYFTLQNAGQISIVRVLTRGVDL